MVMMEYLYNYFTQLFFSNFLSLSLYSSTGKKNLLIVLVIFAWKYVCTVWKIFFQNNLNVHLQTYCISRSDAWACIIRKHVQVFCEQTILFTIKLREKKQTRQLAD